MSLSTSKYLLQNRALSSIIRTSTVQRLNSLNSLQSRYLSSPAPSQSSEQEKGFFQKLWDKNSYKGNLSRHLQSERLFRTAQIRAFDPQWYNSGHISPSFKSKHAILTMHIWFLHKRLLQTDVNRYAALLVQEQMFEAFWADTLSRIRAEKVPELTTGRHLKNMQKTSFLQCMNYDHVFELDSSKDRREELCRAVWNHLLGMDENAPDDLINRLAMYIEFQHDNIMYNLPEEYWREVRIDWGAFPDFKDMVDNNGVVMPNRNFSLESKEDVLPEDWEACLNQAGETYYWNKETNRVTWGKPFTKSNK